MVIKHYTGGKGEVWGTTVGSPTRVGGAIRRGMGAFSRSWSKKSRKIGKSEGGGIPNTGLSKLCVAQPVETWEQPRQNTGER